MKKIILSAIAIPALVFAAGASAQATKSASAMNNMTHATSSKAMRAKMTTSHMMASHKVVSRTEERTESKAQERSEMKAHSRRHHHRSHHETAAQERRENRHHHHLAKHGAGAIKKTTSVTSTITKK